MVTLRKLCFSDKNAVFKIGCSIFREDEIPLLQKALALCIEHLSYVAVEDKKIIGVMTSRPLHVDIINKSKLDVYYVDYLCIEKNYRKKNIAPQLIQTHEYNQAYSNRNICVSLFKREEELTSIIPLTLYSTYCFNMKNWSAPIKNDKIKILIGDKQNLYYFYNFIKETKKKWGITILPEISNLIELVNTKNLYIIMLLSDQEIISAYIFKKTCTFIEKEKEIISCISSIQGPNITNENFILGFKNSLWTIKKNFHYIAIENISDNKIIIDNIKTHPIAKSPMAYFFYNFAYPTFSSNKVFIVN
jgi:hypothetical protein